MNRIRLGYAETDVLFFYYLTIKKIKVNYVDIQNHIIQWLYSTSGFYDKKIKGSYFDFNTNVIKRSKIYNVYFRELLRFVKTNNIWLELNFHEYDDDLLQYKEEFLQFINYYNKKTPLDYNIFTFMDNKHILIINNLGSLMKQQFESGNIFKICDKFPKNVKSIQYYENGYTFLNNGHDSCILETSYKICQNIRQLNFDVAIISAGAYSWLFSNFIINILKKEVYVTGGDLPLYFGIITKRIKHFSSDKINEYFITVPDEMKPPGYEKIEDGCYW